MKENRKQQLHQWLARQFSTDGINLSNMTGDAGFRRYFRFMVANQSYIAVDAPTDKCNNNAFVDIAYRLQNAGINVPTIVASDLARGFLCLSDLGDQLLTQLLTPQSMEHYYQQAIELLPSIAQVSTEQLPLYDQTLIQTELEIFPQWLLKEHLALQLTNEQQVQLQQCFDILIDNALSQPNVFMHRDFHSRNIMQQAGKLAVIDFQDAVVGPISYDIVSLLRDCYIKWPRKQVKLLLDHYIDLMESAGLVEKYDRQLWQRWFDLMGLQRHIKASGIFARLFHRDKKPGYLADIPLTLSYIVEVSADYPQLCFLHHLVKNEVLAKLNLQQLEAVS
ncbi:phosphotransferase [Thalassotalea sp. G2M2-11]|uniref:aminoglycoside phosphotransferase family protein n=1 Tax=Thalassotalea sp. G2M2-11 TaxID=2787627 RepID=UPI0019D1C707|nr:phosphotransferase [Thalassotalea sp. G2M2-11]